jgi:hypothetical protein
MTPIETICNYLNDINQKDPMVLKSLSNNRIPCNNQIVNHPHAVVGSDNTIGIMGLLNGALEAAGIGKISYTTDGSNIMKFAPYESTHDCPTRMSQSAKTSETADSSDISEAKKLALGQEHCPNCIREDTEPRENEGMFLTSCACLGIPYDTAIRLMKRLPKKAAPASKYEDGR